MTPREPDRFEAKALDLLCNIFGKQTDPYWTPDPVTLAMVAAALREAESSALERAAQLFDVKPGGRSRDAKYVSGKWVSPDAEAIRALIPPAAAPEIPDTCPEEGCVLEENHDGPCDTDVPEPAAAPAAETCPEPPPGLVETLEKVHGMGCGNIATQRIPARPSEPAAPAPDLLSRILVALEEWAGLSIAGRKAITAELRQYIASVEGKT